MLGLRENIGGDPRGISVGRDDDDFSGSGDEVDTGFARDQFLCSRDVNVAGSDDSVDLGPVSVP